MIRILYRLIDIDRRIIFVFVFLGVAVPLLKSCPLPINPTDPVLSVYREIEGVAEKNGVVLLSFSYGASTVPEMQPMARAILRHCFSRDVKVVAISLWPEATGLAQQVIEETAREFGKTYGVDYVFTGYKPGNYSVILNMGQSILDAFPVDHHGTPLENLGLTEDPLSLRDFDFVFDLAAGDSIEFWWIPYGQEKYGFSFGGGCTAVMAPDLFPFIQSGQMVGVLGGLSGAAEYESILKKPGKATAGMSAQSMAHLIIVVFIIFGNIVYFFSRRISS